MKPTGLYYDREGQPMELMEWAQAIEAGRNVVAKTKLSGGVEVSTVWIGLNHQWGDGPPLIFETMVFGGAMDQEQNRYSTETEAKAGHREMVVRVKKAKP